MKFLFGLVIGFMFLMMGCMTASYHLEQAREKDSTMVASYCEQYCLNTDSVTLNLLHDIPMRIAYSADSLAYSTVWMENDTLYVKVGHKDLTK